MIIFLILVAIFATIGLVFLVSALKDFTFPSIGKEELITPTLVTQLSEVRYEEKASEDVKIILESLKAHHYNGRVGIYTTVNDVSFPLTTQVHKPRTEKMISKLEVLGWVVVHIDRPASTSISRPHGALLVSDREITEDEIARGKTV